MQELGRWCLLFNPEESLEVKYQSGGGVTKEIYVPKMPEGLDLFYKIVGIVILST